MKRPTASRWAFVLAAGAIVVYQLILPPVVGLADNGDFAKVIGRFNLHARYYKTYVFADTKYDFSPANHWAGPFLTSEIPLAQAAVWLHAAAGKTEEFDIRYIGVIHGALFLLALWLFHPLLEDQPRILRWMVYGLVLFFYCDVKYVAPLNSFYMDEAAYLFLLLTAAALLRVLRWHRMRDAILLLLCPLPLITSKTQHVLLGLWIAALLAIAAKALRPLRPRVWYAASALLAVAGALMIWKGQPAEYAPISLYGVTFTEILPHSKDVGRALADLGLDDSYRSWVGKGPFDSDSGLWNPSTRDPFLRRYSYVKLARFYLKRPAAAWRTLRHGLAEAANQHGFGNFDASTGYIGDAESHAFAGWSDLRRSFFHNGSALFFAFAAGCALLSWLLWLSRGNLPQGAAPAGVCLMAAAFTEMSLTTLCDALDTVRHAMLFLALFDMILIACAWLALRRALGWKGAPGA